VYLSELETPEYYTLKHTDNKISRIWYPLEDVEKADSDYDFYGDMINNSKDDSVYDLLHSLNGEHVEGAVSAGRFITQKDKFPETVSIEQLLELIDNGIIELDDSLAESGFVHLNIVKLSKFPQHINSFVEVIDKSGNLFIEVVFRES